MDQLKTKHAALLIAAACLIGIAIGSTATSALLNSQRSIPSTGTVLTINVEAYSNPACTLNLTAIDWGNIYPGEPATQTIYVKNTGNAPLTLSMATNTWNPANAQGQLTVAWNKEGATLNPTQSSAADLTLTASPTISNVASFTVNIVITGSG